MHPILIQFTMKHYLLILATIAAMCCGCNSKSQNYPPVNYTVAYLNGFEFREIPYDNTYYCVIVYDENGEWLSGMQVTQMMRKDYLYVDGKYTFHGGIKLDQTKDYFFKLYKEDKDGSNHFYLLKDEKIPSLDELKKQSYPTYIEYTHFINYGCNLRVAAKIVYLE